ncbi:hypothetical protein Pst134EB_026602 [Puccinia striiformis f. sp. tritici]|nr:hypothetical protein Pst134EB_026602 [Puccinia striiformis f. sp. tritici]
MNLPTLSCINTLTLSPIRFLSDSVPCAHLISPFSLQLIRPVQPAQIIRSEGYSVHPLRIPLPSILLNQSSLYWTPVHQQCPYLQDMVPRKRPQLCAVDFFDLPPPESPVIKNPSNSIDADYASLTNRRDEANPGMYLSVLKGLDPDSLARELIRGKDKFDYDASIGGPYVFILQANNSMVKITDSLKVYHIATLLWGPGQREVFGGKEIHSGRLEYKVEDSGFVTAAPLYAIKFDSIRSAECASFTIEYHLNRFLDALNKEEGAPPLQVQTKIGSSRWLIEEMGSKGEPQWKAVQHRFRSLRPIIKQETTSPPERLTNQQSLSFRNS